MSESGVPMTLVAIVFISYVGVLVGAFAMMRIMFDLFEDDDDDE